MKPVHIFRHIDCEGPGYLADFLHHYSIPFKLVRIDAGEAVLSQLDEVSALVFMGGSMSVNDDLPWINEELSLIRRARERGIPMLGHCLGGQLISKALGGIVSQNPVKEIGWLPVHTTPGILANDWLDGLDQENLLFHWHGETFSIPDEGTAIMHSEHCAHQAFVLDNILALQCHVEMDARMVEEWVTRYANELQPVSATVQAPEQILKNLEKKTQRLKKVADVLYRRWLRGVTKYAES